MSELAKKLIEVLGGKNAQELAKKIDGATPPTPTFESDVVTEYGLTPEKRINDYLTTSTGGINGALRTALGLTTLPPYSFEAGRAVPYSPTSPEFNIIVTTGNPALTLAVKQKIEQTVREIVRENVTELKSSTFDVKVKK